MKNEKLKRNTENDEKSEKEKKLKRRQRRKKGNDEKYKTCINEEKVVDGGRERKENLCSFFAFVVVLSSHPIPLLSFLLI